MATPVIEEMARAIRAEINNQEWTDSEELARSALKALEENITDEMIKAGWEPDGTQCDHPKCVFTAMLRAAREE